MLLQEKISIIIQISTLIGLIFAVYLYFRKPQEKSDITDAVFDVRFNALEKTVINLRDNHIHTLDMKLDKHIQDNQIFMLENTKTCSRIETLIEQLMKK